MPTATALGWTPDRQKLAALSNMSDKFAALLPSELISGLNTNSSGEFSAVFSRT